MFIKLFYPCIHILHRRAVSRQQQVHVELFHLGKAVQIRLQRIVRPKLNSDVRCDRTEDMVSAEKYLFLFVIQAHVPRRVARREYRFKPVAAILQHIPFIHICKVNLRIVHILSSRMYVGVPSELSLREPELQEHVVQYRPVEIARFKIHQLSVRFSRIDDAVFLCEFRHKTAVIRMQMRDEHVHLVDLQLVKSALQRLFAFRPVEPRIDQQTLVSRFFAGYYVCVDLSQRIVRQRHYLFIYIVSYFR